MKGFLVALAFIVLVSCVYVGAMVTVTGERLRPITMSEFLDELTSYDYGYSDFEAIIEGMQSVWNDEPEPLPNDATFWDEATDALVNSAVGQVFRTLGYVLELIVVFVVDLVKSLIFVFRVFSLLFTGVPV